MLAFWRVGNKGETPFQSRVLCWTTVLNKDSCSYDFLPAGMKLFNVCAIVVKWQYPNTCVERMMTENMFPQIGFI